MAESTARPAIDAYLGGATGKNSYVPGGAVKGQQERIDLQRSIRENPQAAQAYYNDYGVRPDQGQQGGDDPSDQSGDWRSMPEFNRNMDPNDNTSFLPEWTSGFLKGALPFSPVLGLAGHWMDNKEKKLEESRGKKTEEYADMRNTAMEHHKKRMEWNDYQKSYTPPPVPAREAPMPSYSNRPSSRGRGFGEGPSQGGRGPSPSDSRPSSRGRGFGEGPSRGGWGPSPSDSSHPGSRYNEGGLVDVWGTDPLARSLVSTPPAGQARQGAAPPGMPPRDGGGSSLLSTGAGYIADQYFPGSGALVENKIQGLNAGGWVGKRTAMLNEGGMAVEEAQMQAFGEMQGMTGDDPVGADYDMSTLPGPDNMGVANLFGYVPSGSSTDKTQMTQDKIKIARGNALDESERKDKAFEAQEKRKDELHALQMKQNAEAHAASLQQKKRQEA